LVGRNGHGSVEFHLIYTVFERLALPGGVDQYPAHRLCSDREKLSPIFPIDFSLISEFEIGLVHQFGRLNRYGVLALKKTTRQASKLVVDNWQQFIKSVPVVTIVPLSDFLQQHRHVTRHKKLWADFSIVLA